MFKFGDRIERLTASRGRTAEGVRDRYASSHSGHRKRHVWFKMIQKGADVTGGSMYVVFLKKG